MQFSHLRHIATILVFLSLGACGGGGGGGSSSDAPAPPPGPTEAVQNDAATLPEDSTASISVLDNDTGINSGTLQITAAPTNGSAEISGTNIRYTPQLNFAGSDQLTYSVNGTSGATLSAQINFTVTPVNDAPTANADDISLIVNTPTDITVLVNDVDIEGDALTVSISSQPTNGTLTESAGIVTYTPGNNFLGNDSFQYSVTDTSNLSSNVTTVSLTVNPITQTSLSVQTLTIPTTGYATQNNAELSAAVFSSPQISFEVPPNTVSISASLTGGDVNMNANNLFISDVRQPNGLGFSPLSREVTFCDVGFCSALIPRVTDSTTPQGTWQLSLGTFAADTSSISFDDMSLVVATRVGPTPTSTTLQVRPFLTATSISTTELDLVLTQFVNMAQQNGITVQLDQTVVVTDPEFTEVARNFSDDSTSALVEMGAANRVNLFFIEDFSGAGGSGVLGISGGLPGPFGQQNRFNGVLVNATANRTQTDQIYARNTAEVTLHEMGHFLGLYHTTERQFDAHDVLDDTPECTTANDRAGLGVVGVADIAECPDGQNIMFWATDLSGNKVPLTTDQREILSRSPIATP